MFGIDIPIPFLIFGAILTLLAMGGAMSLLGEKRRRDAVASIAEQLGLSFVEDGGAGLLSELSDLPLFSRGRSKRITNLIQGETDEVLMAVFDYQYTTGSGKNAHTSRQTVAFFRSPGMNLPRFELKPQNFLHGIGKLFGYQDFDFPSHRKFSRMFVLRGTHEAQLRRVFTADVLSFFETKPQVSVEAQGHDLVFYRQSQRVKPDQLRERMGEGFEVWKRFALGEEKS
ncbi:MAG: hypothetical protein ACYC3X_19340 [Pirellulaceae bacterium]